MTFVRPSRAETRPRRRLGALPGWVAAGLLAGFSSGVLAAVAANDAVTTVAELHAGLLAAAERRDDPFAERYAALAPLIMATHDLDYIGQITIRREWRNLTAQQQAEFGEAFRRLAIANYVARFGGLQNASFAIVGNEALPQGRQQVSAILHPEGGESVTLNYVLHDIDTGEWKVINVVANGVSDLALKRAEFQRVLQDGGFAGLLEHLHTQSERLAEP